MAIGRRIPIYYLKFVKAYVSTKTLPTELHWIYLVLMRLLVFVLK